MAMYVDETGSADAPTIVFLHGGGGGGWMWRPQVEALRSEFHLLVPDLPEHGRSAGGAPFTMSGAATEVAGLIRGRAHGGHATVVGLSEGAQVTLALLALAPEVVDHAIVSSALVRKMPGAWMMTPGVAYWTFQLTTEPFKKSEWWMRANMRGAAGVPDEYVDDFRRTFRATTAASFSHVIGENQAFRLPARLEKVTAPVLAVCGHGEYEVMRRSTIDVAAAIPSAEAREVFHVGKMSVAQQHNWNMTEPVLFTDMVRAWIAGYPLPDAIKPLAVSPRL
jgi:pimeloyl-ACP methyl ester carboxylesterase